MSYLNNQINYAKNYDNNNINLIENSAKFNLNGNYEANRYKQTKPETGQMKNISININNKGNLIYKSIFNHKKFVKRNNSNNKEYINEEKYNINEENVNQILEKNNYKNKDIIPKKKNIKPRKYEYSIEKDDEDNSLMNFSEQRGNYINSDNYSNKEKKLRQYSSNHLQNRKYESNSKDKINQKNSNSNFNTRIKNNINFKNNQENLDMIIDKNDFIKNIKEIDDLNYLDEIDKKTEDFFMTTENINNLILDENYLIPSNDNYEKAINILQTMPLNSRIPEINNDFKPNRNNFEDNIKSEIHNNINETNKNVLKNNSNKIIKYKQKINNLNTKNYSNKILNSNKSNETRLMLNKKSFYDKDKDNNYLNIINSKKYLTLSHRDEQVKSEAKNLKIGNNQIFPKNLKKLKNKYKAKKSNNLSYELNENNEQNNYIKQMPNNNEFDDDNLEFKKTIQKLSNDINDKNKKINALIKIIKQEKKKNEILEKNNNILKEENKRNQELLKKLKYAIIVLKKKQRNNNLSNNDYKENNVNINYNYINSNDKIQQNIKELENQIEKYKKENNDLKLLLKQYQNNNYEEITSKQNLLNKFNKSDFSGSNNRKKSYSVSKNKVTLRYSIVSNKTFQEDDV